jgi:hypothetical protein
VTTLSHRRSTAIAPWALCLSLFLAVVFVPTLGTHGFLHAAPVPAHGKEKPYALIFGTVWGPDNHPLYGVKVKIRRSKDKKAKWELFSDHRGEFAQRVPAGEGDYVLWADLKGYKSPDGKPLHLPQEVVVHIYNDERSDTGLHLTE